MASIDHESLYDEYLRAASAGEAQSPEEYLNRHGVDDSALLGALRAIHAVRRSDVVHGGRIGDYQLIRRLGEGGMGVVWLAEQASLGRRVALKVLRAEAAMSLGNLARFEREARALGRLHHPSIVHVYGVGESGGTRYIAMEYVEGRGLDEVIADASASGAPVKPIVAARWGASLARALHAAHEAGIVHRDIKPSNIRVTPDDRVVLLDFGLAREAGSNAPTLTEAFVGSPYYASPEQVGRGLEVDARTDVYSLGAVLYELVTGVKPVREGTLEQVLRSILEDEPVFAHERAPCVPRALSIVITKAMHKDPQRRYADALALALDLEAVSDMRPIVARGPGVRDRTLRWGRRNKAAAGAITAGLVVLLVACSAFGVQQWRRAEARRQDQRSALRDASTLLHEFRSAAASLRLDEARLAKEGPERGARYFTPDEDRALDELEGRVQRARRDREGTFNSALAAAARAERLGAARNEVNAIRADLYVERALESEAAGRFRERAMYATLARASDTTGAVEERLTGTSVLSIVTDPPGAEVHVFRRVIASEEYEHAEPRRVLIPRARLPEGVRADAWGLHVLEPTGELREGDVITALEGHPIRECVLIVSARRESPAGVWDRLVAIDGERVNDEYEIALARAESSSARTFEFLRRDGSRASTTGTSLDALGIEVSTPREIVLTMPSLAKPVRATVWHDGAPRELQLTGGVKTVTTAAPALLGPASLVGVSPALNMAVEPGSYVVVIRDREGREWRDAFDVHRDTRPRVELRLFAERVPDGFVALAGAPHKRDLAPHPYAIMRREVTCREYYEFLNDPETRARIERAPDRLHYPYNSDEARGQRGADGVYLLPDGWGWDWPILCITWHDAKAYADWRTRRARDKGEDWVFDLPTLYEWVRASAPALGDPWVFGDRFHPKWTSSCYSRPRPDPEPVMRFPVDESALGVYDLAGSAMEWTSDIWRPGYSYMRHAGGAWGMGDERSFTIYGGNGSTPETRSGSIGFRLVARLHDAENPGANTIPH